MKLMNLDKMPVESTWMRTPSVKKPMSADTVEKGLELTPPPVVNQQSETCWMLLYKVVHFMHTQENIILCLNERDFL